MIKLEAGKSVVIIFRNNMTVSGIVKKWDGEYILETIDRESFIIITRPDDDIMAVKVMSSVQPNLVKTETPVVATAARRYEEVAKEISKIIEEPQENMNPQSLKIKKLADLHRMAVESEKNLVKAKLQEHTVQNYKNKDQRIIMKDIKKR